MLAIGPPASRFKSVFRSHNLFCFCLFSQRTTMRGHHLNFWRGYKTWKQLRVRQWSSGVRFEVIHNRVFSGTKMVNAFTTVTKPPLVSIMKNFVSIKIMSCVTKMLHIHTKQTPFCSPSYLLDRGKFGLVNTIIDKTSLFVHGMYSSAVCTASWMGELRNIINNINK